MSGLDSHFQSLFDLPVLTMPDSIALPTIALATCAAYPELDIDDRLLLAPLQELGLQPTIAVWNDPTVQWQDYDLVLIRSTWDYTRHHDEFLEWAIRVAPATELVNPLSVLTWSSDKTYLNDLEQAGVNTVPTKFIAPGQAWSFPDGEFVVKPSISAGSRDTFRLSASNHGAGDRVVRSLHDHNRTAMIQPYLHSVDVSAETAMIFIEDHFSHAISKAALLPLDQSEQVFERGLFLREKISRTQARPEQLDVATAALRCAPSGWLYARVDLIDDAYGRPLVLELEMVEPSLFLGFHDAHEPAPAEVLSRSIASRLGLR